MKIVKDFIEVRQNDNMKFYKIYDNEICITYRIYPLLDLDNHEEVFEDIDCIFGLYGNYKLKKENDYYLVTLPVLGKDIDSRIVRLILCREGIGVAFKVSKAIEKVEVQDITTKNPIAAEDLCAEADFIEMQTIRNNMTYVKFGSIELFY